MSFGTSFFLFLLFLFHLLLRLPSESLLPLDREELLEEVNELPRLFFLDLPPSNALSFTLSDPDGAPMATGV